MFLFTAVLTAFVWQSTGIIAEGSATDANGVHVNNIVADAGSSVLFNCSVHNSSAVRWVHVTLGNQHELVVIRNTVTANYSSRFKVISYNQLNQLSVENVSVSDAGEYECINSNNSLKLLTASLTVVTEVRQCYLTTSCKGFSVNCSVCWVGTTEPHISCYSGQSSHTHSTSKQNETTENSSLQENASCRWLIRKWTDVMDRNLFSSKSTCSVDLTPRAAHEPGSDYKYRWISHPVIPVAYGPCSVAIQPTNKTLFHDGETLNCSADGYPQPEYQWTVTSAVNSSLLIVANQTGPIFTFNTREVVQSFQNDSTLNQSTLNLTVECLAKNDVRTLSETVNVFVEIECHHQGTSSPLSNPDEQQLTMMTLVLVVVCAAVSVTVATLVIILILMQKGVKCTKRQEHTPVPVEENAFFTADSSESTAARNGHLLAAPPLPPPPLKETLDRIRYTGPSHHGNVTSSADRDVEESEPVINVRRSESPAADLPQEQDENEIQYADVTVMKRMLEKGKSQTMPRRQVPAEATAIYAYIDHRLLE